MLDNNVLNKRLLWIDSFIIFLNLSASYSLIPYLLFFQYHRFVNLIIITFVNLLYLIMRPGMSVGRIPYSHKVFYLYIAINLSCLITVVATDGYFQGPLAYLVSNTIFYFTLYNIFKMYFNAGMSSKTLLWYIFRGYLILAIISIISIAASFVLIKFHLLDPYSNSCNTMCDLFYDNYEDLGSNYFFPSYLTVFIVTPDLRVPFFQDGGIICGFYHEPHCMTFMLFPALFLLLYYLKTKIQKYIAVGLFLLTMLIAASTTNIMALSACLFLYLLYTMRDRKKAFVSFLLLSIIAVIVYENVDFSFFNFINEKIESTSNAYSQATLKFALYPTTFFGYSFYDTSWVVTTDTNIPYNVGYMSFAINILFLVFCAKKLFCLFIRKEKIAIHLFLFASYFFIHSTKIAMVSYSLSMLMYVAFIITCFSQMSTVYEEN